MILTIIERAPRFKNANRNIYHNIQKNVVKLKNNMHISCLINTTMK